MKKMAVVSLGCTKNLVDTEIMLGQLNQAGLELTTDFAEADLILVNTCGFIESAKQESIDNILEMAQYKKTGVGKCQKLVVAGCLVQRYADELRAELPEVDYWVGLGEIGQVLAIINDNNNSPATLRPYLNDENLPRLQVTFKHTAYVKIAEGCNHRCSYCAIPLIKGGFKSRTPDSIIKEVKGLVEKGVKEINLIAQDITMYGYDLTQVKLQNLLERIVNEAGPAWIRLLYAYPSGIDEPLLSFIASQPTICNYLDLPFQHINGRILKLMNRSDTPDQLRSKLDLIKTIVPGISLRTTLIVGFPSETEAEFLELLNFVKEGYFQHLGVFTYSREEGTKAYRLEPQIAQEEKERRRSLILEAQQLISATFLKSKIGSVEAILVDDILKDGRAVGRTAGFAPDIDGVVYLDTHQVKPGVICKGLITGSGAYHLEAKQIGLS